MFNYIIKRLLYIIPTLIGITVITFVVINLAPGEPTDMNTALNPDIDQKAVENMRKLYGLDKPIYIRYFLWLGKVLMLDFGHSFKDDRKVIDKVLERLPATLELNLISMFLIFIIGVPLGIISATKQYSWIDKMTTVLAFIGFSAPSFWIALLLIILFGVKLPALTYTWFGYSIGLPFCGMSSLDAESYSTLGKLWDHIMHLILPVTVYTIGGFASISRYARSGMLDVVRQDYIRTARAKGLGEGTVIYKHAFRNALIPIITLVGLMLPTLIGGSFILETIFAWPGMGRLGFDAVMARDYPVVMGTGVIAALLTLMGNLMADIGYALADPRIKY